MGGARACALRVAVRCDARVEAGARGLAAGRARASCVMGLRTFSSLSVKVIHKDGKGGLEGACPCGLTFAPCIVSYS